MMRGAERGRFKREIFPSVDQSFPNVWFSLSLKKKKKYFERREKSISLPLPCAEEVQVSDSPWQLPIITGSGSSNEPNLPAQRD